jgi:hypothetical protein
MSWYFVAAPQAAVRSDAAFALLREDGWLVQPVSRVHFELHPWSRTFISASYRNVLKLNFIPASSA